MDKRLKSESKTSFDTLDLEFLGMVIGGLHWIINAITFLISGISIPKPGKYKPKRWEVLGILAGLVVDVAVFLGLIASASAM